jgi:hypothetical protein
MIHITTRLTSRTHWRHGRLTQREVEYWAVAAGSGARLDGKAATSLKISKDKNSLSQQRCGPSEPPKPKRRD